MNCVNNSTLGEHVLKWENFSNFTGEMNSKNLM